MIQSKKISLSNGETITAKHLGYALKIIGAMVLILISTLSYMYRDYIIRQEIRDIKQDNDMERFYNELIGVASANSITIEIVKEYIEGRDKIDLDPKINERYKSRFRDRGKTIGKFVPQDKIAARTFY